MNLATVRRLLEKHQTDSCVVTREKRGYHDDVLDIVSGALVPTVVSEAIYSGPCMVTPTAAGQTVEGARVVERRGYRIRVPHDVGPFRRGDKVVLAAADPALDGRILILTAGSEGATLDHGTTLAAEDAEAIEPQ